MKKRVRFQTTPIVSPQVSLFATSMSDSFGSVDYDDIPITETPIQKVNQSVFKLDLSRVLREKDSNIVECKDGIQVLPKDALTINIQKKKMKKPPRPKSIIGHSRKNSMSAQRQEGQIRKETPRNKNQQKRKTEIPVRSQSSMAHSRKNSKAGLEQCRNIQISKGKLTGKVPRKPRVLNLYGIKFEVPQYNPCKVMRKIVRKTIIDMKENIV